jgi:hypothetical protein
MKMTRLLENLATASVLAAPAHVEVDPDFAKQLPEYGYSHVDAHH